MGIAGRVPARHRLNKCNRDQVHHPHQEEIWTSMVQVRYDEARYGNDENEKSPVCKTAIKAFLDLANNVKCYELERIGWCSYLHN